MSDHTTNFALEHPPHALVADPANLIAILWRGRKLIGMSVLICVLLAGLYLVNSQRLYQATAKLLILQQGGRPLNVANSDQGRFVEGGEDYVPTHAMVIRSPMVVGHAIEMVGLRNLPSLASAPTMLRAVQDVGKNLTVTRPDRLAKILQIDYRAFSPEEATLLVDAISNSYRSFLEDVYQKNNSDVILLMTRAQNDLNKELKELEQKYLEFRQESPLLVSDGTGRPLISKRVEEWNRATNESMVRGMQLREQLELARKLSANGIGLWSMAYAIDQIGGTNGGLGARTQNHTPAQPSDYVRGLHQAQQQLISQYGPQNTKVRELQEEITQIVQQTRGSRNQIEQAEIRDLVDSIELSLKSIESMHTKMSKQVEQDLAIAKKTETALLAEANLKSNLDRQRALFNTVVDQLKQAKLVGDFSTIRSHTIESANALPKPVRPLVGLTLALALAAGCVLGVGAAAASELIDPRIRSLDDMRKVLRLPLLGHVPQLPVSAGPVASPVGLICHATPRSPAAEAYKVVRTNFDLVRRNRDIRVVLITSAHSAEGKSTVASNLAICLAQAGRKVLLVDADLRHPEQYRLHRLQRERGLVHVLRDLMSTHRIIQPTAINNLDCIASGPEVPNPAELLSSPMMHEFLTAVRESYETVIIDAPPLLTVADSSIVGAVVDGIVLVVRAAETKRDEATRAVEILKGLGTPILGAIVNGVRPDEGTRGRSYYLGGGARPRPVEEIRLDPKFSLIPSGSTPTIPSIISHREPSHPIDTEGEER